ncbi:hypothetical protein CLOP_g24828 [Closterium sp. NIES-67]|nr:hypothetical protein CLOP_g24828 [Closterium sp. NIES-67]
MLRSANNGITTSVIISSVVTTTTASRRSAGNRISKHVSQRVVVSGFRCQGSGRLFLNAEGPFLSTGSPAGLIGGATGTVRIRSAWPSNATGSAGSELSRALSADGGVAFVSSTCERKRLSARSAAACSLDGLRHRIAYRRLRRAPVAASSAIGREAGLVDEAAREVDRDAVFEAPRKERRVDGEEEGGGLAGAREGEPSEGESLNRGDRREGPGGDLPAVATFAKGVREFVTSNFLLVAISTGIALAVLFPAPGIYAQSKIGLARYCTFGIFLVSGIALDLEQLRQVPSSWPAFLYGSLSTLVITPLMALLVLRLPLLPRELPTGLALFCCMPASITAGISLARAAGANAALALGLTVVTNTVGILTMPLLLSRLVPASGGVSLPAGPLLRALVTTLLVPLFIGMAVRKAMPALATWADHHKQQLSMANNAMLAFVPWMQVSSSRAAILGLNMTQLLPIAATGIAVHLSFLTLNVGAMAALRRITPPLLPQEANAVDRAVIILSSQKTLPVAAAVVGKIGTLLGEPGLVLLPCILTHFIQIFSDSLLVNKWLSDDRERDISDCKTT